MAYGLVANAAERPDHTALVCGDRRLTFGALARLVNRTAHALAARGVVRNLRGYTLYGDYQEPNPPARIVEAVAKGEVDVAVAWGPLAGYFAPRQRVPLEVVPVSPQFDLPYLPFVYDISMGVRRDDEELRRRLDDFLERRRPEIERILDEYGVPRVAGAQASDASLTVR